MTDDPEAIDEIIRTYRAEAAIITANITEIMWYMRSMGREDAWAMSYRERATCMKLIEANIKRVNDTKLPIL